MNLTDIVLVTENDKGTETNMLMTVDDYKRFVDIKDLSDLSEQMLRLGSNYIRMTEHMQASVGMVPSGNVREESS